MKNFSRNVTRRQITVGSLWAAPIVLASAAIPAYASSNKTDLAVEVADPPINWDTWGPDYIVPVYSGENGTTIKFKASFPQKITVTNVGTKPASQPTGEITLTMRDYGSDFANLPYRLMATQRNNLVIWSSGVRSTDTNGVKYTYTYSGTLTPGESFDIIPRYYVPTVFSNLDFNLLVQATVVDEQEGDYDDNSERLGIADSSTIG